MSDQENILVDQNGRAALCDFGLSIVHDGLPTGHTTSNFGGSLRYLAPELSEENSTRTTATDIYALGCTLAEVGFYDCFGLCELPTQTYIPRRSCSTESPSTTLKAIFSC